MRLYAVSYDCPHCGKAHQVIGAGPGLGLVIPHGPTEAGSVAELWPRGNYPPAVAEVVRGKVWCDQAGDYIPMDDPARLELVPPTT